MARYIFKQISPSVKHILHTTSQVGTHDLDTIQGPFTYMAKPPQVSLCLEFRLALGGLPIELGLARRIAPS